MGRTQLYAISIGAHALLGAYLGGLPQAIHHEIIAITMSDAKKVPEAPPPPPPPPPEPVVAPAVAPVKAKTAPPKAAPEEALPVDAPPPSPVAESVPDFGLSLSNGAGALSGGLAVPAGSPSGTGSGGNGGAKTLTRTLARPADDCTEQPSKPKALSRVSPVYPEAAKAAGIVGKVRVEITVDARGNVSGVKVIEGLGHGLDEACIAAARAMTFEPAQRCGKPTSAVLKVGFAF